MNRIALTLALSLSLAAQSSAGDFRNVTSGLLLGIYGSPSQGGMQVTGTIPGYSAQGRLHPGDILMRATIDGWTMYNLRSHFEMEQTKGAIGAGREAAIEIYRPGHGYIYAWVEFTPIYAPAQVYSTNGVRTRSAAPSKAKASFRMESEKPGARQMFQKRSNTSLRPQNTRKPVPAPIQPNTGSNRSAANLFNR